MASDKNSLIEELITGDQASNPLLVTSLLEKYIHVLKELFDDLDEKFKNSKSFEKICDTLTSQIDVGKLYTPRLIDHRYKLTEERYEEHLKKFKQFKKEEFFLNYFSALLFVLIAKKNDDRGDHVNEELINQALLNANIFIIETYRLVHRKDPLNINHVQIARKMGGFNRGKKYNRLKEKALELIHSNYVFAADNNARLVQKVDELWNILDEILKEKPLASEKKFTISENLRLKAKDLLEQVIEDLPKASYDRPAKKNIPKKLETEGKRSSMRTRKLNRKEISVTQKKDLDTLSKRLKEERVEENTEITQLLISARDTIDPFREPIKLKSRRATKKEIFKPLMEWLEVNKAYKEELKKPAEDDATLEKRISARLADWLLYEPQFLDAIHGKYDPNRQLVKLYPVYSTTDSLSYQYDKIPSQGSQYAIWQDLSKEWDDQQASNKKAKEEDDQESHTERRWKAKGGRLSTSAENKYLGMVCPFVFFKKYTVPVVYSERSKKSTMVDVKIALALEANGCLQCLCAWFYCDMRTTDIFLRVVESPILIWLDIIDDAPCHETSQESFSKKFQTVTKTTQIDLTPAYRKSNFDEAKKTLDLLLQNEGEKTLYLLMLEEFFKLPKSIRNTILHSNIQEAFKCFENALVIQRKRAFSSQTLVFNTIRKISREFHRKFNGKRVDRWNIVLDELRKFNFLNQFKLDSYPKECSKIPIDEVHGHDQFTWLDSYSRKFPITNFV